MNGANIVSFPSNDPVDAVESVDDLVRIPERDYAVCYAGFALSGAYGGRLRIDFKIIETGTEAFGTVVPAWYAATVLNRKSNHFKVARHSKFARDWRLIFGHGIARWDRVPMSALKNITLKVAINTVNRDHDRKPIAPVNQYSVVSNVLGRVQI
jgi:hypothetical protein